MSNDIYQRLERLAAGGWDGLEDPGAEMKRAADEMMQAEREERRRQARVLRDCFATPAGSACLALLRKKTVDRPPTAAELGEASVEAFALAQARRQGAANLIFMIEAALSDEPSETEGQ